MKIIQKKGFTLVETLIVVVIVGMLTTVLFRAYSTISQTSARIDNEKTVSSQLGFLQNYIQSFVNGARLDFEIYTGNNKTTLKDNGWTNKISLNTSKIVKNIDIYQTGECYDFTGSLSGFSKSIFKKKCRIEANIDNKITELTDKNKVYISNFKFQVFPQKYYTGSILKYFEKENSQYWKAQGFWLFGQIWVRNRNQNRVSNIHNNFQYFFGF